MLNIFDGMSEYYASFCCKCADFWLMTQLVCA